MNMEKKDFMKAVRKCLNDKCDETCPLYGKDDCEYELLDLMMRKMGILVEDYTDWMNGDLNKEEPSQDTALEEVEI